MSIDDKLQDTLANLEVAAINMKTYAVFGDLSEQLDTICKVFEQRMKKIDQSSTFDA